MIEQIMHNFQYISLKVGFRNLTPSFRLTDEKQEANDHKVNKTIHQERPCCKEQKLGREDCPDKQMEPEIYARSHQDSRTGSVKGQRHHILDLKNMPADLA